MQVDLAVDVILGGRREACAHRRKVKRTGVEVIGIGVRTAYNRMARGGLVVLMWRL